VGDDDPLGHDVNEVRPGATISVVIPTRNRADLVTRTIRRLGSLPERPDEIVVVDDGSTDDTVERLRRIAPAPILVSGDGSGPATARNRGAGASSGDWVVFLDDDDEPHPEWSAALRRLIDQNPAASYVSIGFERSVDGAPSVVDRLETGPAFGPAPANFVAGTFAVRRQTFEEVGGFLGGLRCMEFTDLALRLLGGHLGAGEIVHDGSIHPLTVHVRPPRQRESQSAEILESSWEQVRSRNPAAFRRDPEFAAAQCSTVAVGWLREGRGRQGRRWLWKAVRIRPNVRDAARLAIALFPPARRRIWGNTRS